MKKLFLSIAAFSAATAVWAAPLTPDEALSRAVGSDRNNIISSSAATPELRFTMSEQGQPMIYVFSKADGKGFLAVAADDTTMPLLGFSDSGSLPACEQELPDGMRYWLGTLAEQAAINASKNVGNRTKTVRVERDKILPLMATKWNQSEPYNNLCPTLNGKRCVTGCVATAFAQVLKFHNYPAKGIGTYSYTWTNGNQQLSFDYGSTTFDWDNMLNTYDSNATSAQKDAVATLMSACGIGVEMKYSPSASGAASRNIVRALLENFGYDKSALYLLRDYYTQSEWEEIIYTNLRDYGPVLYGGQSNDGGHEFVCDGYAYGMFHFNWGWGGMSDGYFSLNALDPDSQGIGGSSSGYNFDQDLVAYVRPDAGTSDYTYQMYTDTGLSIDTNEITQGQTVAIGYGARNYSPVAISDIYLGMAITPVNGGDARNYFTTKYSDSLDCGWGFSSLTARITISDYSDGVYMITPVFKITEEGTVNPIRVAVNETRMIYMTVNGNNVTFSPVYPADITTHDLTLETPLYKGCDFKVSATLANTSDDAEFYGTVVAALVKDNEMVAIGNDALAYLAPGESKYWEYLSPLRYFVKDGQTVVPPAGTYQLILYKKVDNTYVQVSDPVEVTLHDQSTPTVSISNLKIADNQDYWNITATADMTCTAGYFAGTVTLYIYPYIPGQSVSSIGRAESDFVAVAAPGVATAPERAPAVGSAPITWHINLANGEPGATYFCNAYLNGTKIPNTQKVFTVSNNVYTGIESVGGEADTIVARRYYTLTGVDLGETCPESGIFIVVESHADGSVTTRKSVR